ncbi:DUF456 domain-containing protein [Halorientalis halophila]|uniref:DUF456 domain-containing protein n=1 Tax=Halorientalis halophila TaxID=3108499 RepID=UPI00300B0927
MTGVVLTTVLGLDLLAWVALGLALVGVVGSLVPLVPGALLSVSGVLLYWWSTGYADPSLPVLIALVSLGLVVIAVDWFAGAISAKVSGAGTGTTVLAGVAGFALFFVAGPVGIFAGVAGVVFLAELRRTGDAGSSARTAAYTTVGMFASTVAQFLLTGLLFLGFLLAVVL